MFHPAGTFQCFDPVFEEQLEDALAVDLGIVELCASPRHGLVDQGEGVAG